MAELQEFIDAQAQVWPQVTRELRQGQKVTHWIWWVFPQLAELGRSPRARHFGLRDAAEAQAYLAHPLLGARLEKCAGLLLLRKGKTPEAILGPVDALKLRSCMTLFEALPSAPGVFAEVLDALYEGSRCPVTSAALAG
ncbi:DUF1810 domain-containing protein [Salipiger sp. PrR002]|uniref:DUF1810 domain-containing protein n=1 Tax=Salipiger sp. PrR002 TaxID=2706489 RepID=UPI0013B67359|nr:DUF1810 domain-containing protein [Salipiger sp. PrR002]NDV98206.1 DUF1810 domain-containing protein [Salipiger sp. PrR002]NDW54918.1 DUF1810 domain-containing protein [Salipiger sp. PrR004]